MLQLHILFYLIFKVKALERITERPACGKRGTVKLQFACTVTLHRRQYRCLRGGTYLYSLSGRHFMSHLGSLACAINNPDNTSHVVRMGKHRLFGNPRNLKILSYEPEKIARALQHGCAFLIHSNPPQSQIIGPSDDLTVTGFNETQLHAMRSSNKI